MLFLITDEVVKNKNHSVLLLCFLKNILFMHCLRFSLFLSRPSLKNEANATVRNSFEVGIFFDHNKFIKRDVALHNHRVDPTFNHL